MLKLIRKISIPVGALAGLGLLLTLAPARPARADFTPGTYLDAQTFVVMWHLQRVSAGVISCTGMCRSAQAAGANPIRCQLIEANQASAAACLTQLSSDCTPQNVVNCSSGER